MISIDNMILMSELRAVLHWKSSDGWISFHAVEANTSLSQGAANARRETSWLKSIFLRLALLRFPTHCLQGFDQAA
jgi:hypothetical protein